MAKRKKPKPQRRERGTGSVSWVEARQRWRAVAPLGTGTAYFRTRGEAEAWLNRPKLPHPATPQPLTDALLDYIAGRTHPRPATTKREEWAVSHIIAHLGDLPLDGVKVSHIEALDKALRKRLAGGSVAGILTLLSSFYDRLIALETPGILRNPVRGYIKTTPARAREGTPARQGVGLDYGMCRLLLKEMVNDPYHAHVAWLLVTGMRVSELAGLRWVNVGADVIRIVEQRREDDRSTPAPLKTERQLGQGRIIPLAQQLLTLTPRGEGLVFPGYGGERFNRRGLAEHLTQACKRAGLPHVTIHDLRHTANSGWADLGLTESGCDALLGHRKGTIGARYTHRTIESLRPYVEEWAGLVLGESGAKRGRLEA